MRTFYPIVIRTAVVLGVIVTMPVLAIPRVNQGLNAWLRPEESEKVADPAQAWEAVAYRASPDGLSGASGPAVAASESAQEKLLRMQQQLDELGADYMLLEASQPDGDSYRFHCRIKLPENSSYARVFEATEDDPVAAMQSVLAEVQRWRSELMGSLGSELRR